MADASGIDVLMKVVGPTGQPFEAESSTVFATKPVMDLLRQGFTPGQFCELREFSFEAGAVSSNDAKEPDNERQQAVAGAGRMVNERLDAIYRGHAERRDRREAKESLDMREVEFTRVMDSMSTQLFQALAGCDTLDSISVVKRKAAGSKNSGDCYLRLDFSKVLITNLDWKDAEHVVLETGKFIYRKLTMRYRPQKPDGTLDVAIQAEWEMKAASGT